MSTPRDDDAQREMEQRALRNVRALVDKYEDSDARDSRSTRRLLVGLFAFLAIGFIVVVGYFYLTAKNDPPRTLVLPPPNKAPR
jgi:hypothetical protein